MTAYTSNSRQPYLALWLFAGIFRITKVLMKMLCQHKSVLPDTFLTLTKFLIPVFRNPKKNRVGDSKALRKNISLWPENFNIIVTSNIAQNKSAKITPNVHNAKVH